MKAVPASGATAPPLATEPSEEGPAPALRGDSSLSGCKSQEPSSPQPCRPPPPSTASAVRGRYRVGGCERGPAAATRQAEARFMHVSASRHLDARCWFPGPDLTANGTRPGVDGAHLTHTRHNPRARSARLHRTFPTSQRKAQQFRKCPPKKTMKRTVCTG